MLIAALLHAHSSFSLMNYKGIVGIFILSFINSNFPAKSNNYALEWPVLPLHLLPPGPLLGATPTLNAIGVH